MSVDFVSSCLCDKQEVTLYSLSRQEAVLWFLFVASCVDSAKSFSTVKLQLDTHTAGHAHTPSTCRYISALYLMTKFSLSHAHTHTQVTQLPVVCCFRDTALRGGGGEDRETRTDLLRPDRLTVSHNASLHPGDALITFLVFDWWLLQELQVTGGLLSVCVLFAVGETFHS